MTEQPTDPEHPANHPTVNEDSLPPEPEQPGPADHTNPDPQPADSVGDDLRTARENYAKAALDAEGRVEYLKAEQAKAQAEAEWSRGKAESLGKMMDDLGIPRISSGTANMKIPDSAIL